MAKEFDMELVYLKKFQDIYEENCESVDNQALISKMQALEVRVPSSLCILSNWGGGFTKILSWT